MKINILILVTEATGGGVERLIFDQMRFYDSKKFNLHVITLRKGYLDAEFSKTSAHYTCLNVKHRLSYKAHKLLREYIVNNSIHIIHTHLYLPDIYGFLMKIAVPRIKLFTTKHNTNQFRKKLFWGVLDNILSLSASRIITVSKSVKQFISKYEHISPSRIKMIYHGVDISRFTNITKKGHLRSRVRIKRNDFVIGVVARITEQKGHEYLFRAVSALKQKIPNIVVLVIGTGDLQQELMDLCQRLKITEHVKFLGHRKDMPDLYRIMDVLCLPSIYEGLGLVLIEAMLCNVPTIGSNIDGITEIIQDGINGFLIPPGDVSVLVQKLRKIYKDEYNHDIIKRAKQNASKFDYRKNLRKIEYEYLRVVYHF